MPRRLLIALGLFMFLLGFTAGFGVHSAMPVPGLPGKVQKVLTLIHSNYYRDVKPDQLDASLFDGMAAALDPYSAYFDRQAWAGFEKIMNSELHGVGIRLNPDIDSGFVKIVAPIEGSPAAAADIRPGDLIIAVNGASIKGKPLDVVVNQIQGPPGSSVTLRIAREGREAFDVKLQRAKIKIPAVKSRMIGDVGYVRVTAFSKGVADEFAQHVNALAAKGAKAWVLDVRFNDGGYLDEAVQMGAMVVGKKTIVETRGRSSKETHVGDRDPLPAFAGKSIVVLIDKHSASAAEIFPGALKDHHAAKLVGERSFGKGSVQVPMDLGDGTFFKMTIALYYTPSGRTPHRDGPDDTDFGILPDVEVKTTAEQDAEIIKAWAKEDSSDAADPQLAKALELLKK